jgi:hypothetical protein
VFGILTALVLAYRAIRGLDLTRHRRWMIRAFAIGIGVGLIRIIIGLFEGLGILTFGRVIRAGLLARLPGDGRGRRGLVALASRPLHLIVHTASRRRRAQVRTPQPTTSTAASLARPPHAPGATGPSAVSAALSGNCGARSA